MLSKELVTIILDVPLEFKEEDLRYVEPDKEKLDQLFTDLEFNALSRRILNIVDKAAPVQGSLFGDVTQTVSTAIPVAEQDNLKNISNSEHSYISITNAIQLKQLFKTLEKAEEFSFETQTTNKDAFNAKLIGLSFSVKPGSAFYVPFGESEEENQTLLENLKPFFENSTKVKIGQSLKFSIKVLANYGINVQGKLIDNMISNYLLHPEQKNNFELLAKKYLDYEIISLEELIGKKAAELGDLAQIPQSKIKDFACENVDISLQLSEKLLPELEKVEMTNLANDIEMPLVHVLAEIEQNGVKLNTVILAEQNEGLTKELQEIESKIYELAGETFNIASPKQLGEVLFDRMQIITNAKKTKTKQYSTSEKELSKLKDKHEIINYILDYRSLAKLKSTYVESLPKLINEKTGKIHTSFNQASVATGRLSSTNPNLQNIPIRTERGRQIRKAFVASSENHILLAADYSQIELRVIAHISKEENMIKAFAENADIHSDTASKIFNVPLEEVTREMRSKAKSANFGIIYGISAFGLAENLGIKRAEAKEIIDNYMATYPEIKNYMDKQISVAREQEYIETISGRRRYLKDINSRNHIVRSLAERNAINAPIQGSAADVIKIAMIKIQARLKDENLQSKMILQVHDELVFDVLKTELEQMKEIVKTEMESAVQISVPLTVDLGTGENWLQAH